MRLLLLGDIVGKPGKRILANLLEKYRLKHGVDFVIANGENIAGGSGITENIAQKLFKCGVDVVTGGDHFRKAEFSKAALDRFERVIRPANYGDHVGGRGSVIVEHHGVRILVFQVVGSVFLEPDLPSPFETADRILEEFSTWSDVRILDFHAEATSEKIAMGWHMDGRVTAVFGTHTHIQTADERILPNGTAYITDTGMVGPYDSVIGRDKTAVLKSFVKHEKTAFAVADGDVQMRGALIDVDPATGRATRIERVALREDDPLSLEKLADLRAAAGIVTPQPEEPNEHAANSA